MSLLLAAAEAPTTLAPIVSTTSTVVELMGVVWQTMTANPLLTFFLGTSLLSVGIRFFRKIKGAARH